MSSARGTGRPMVVGLFVLVLALWLMAGCADTEGKTARRQHNIYFGWLLGTGDIVALAFDVGATNRQGERVVRAYVCNGLGGANGVAAWFRESVNDETVRGGEQTTILTSGGGQESLTISHLDDHGVSGTFTGVNGQTLRFAAFPTSDGAGIYYVTLDEGLRYSGTSTNDSMLDGQADEEGNVVGTITTVAGQEIEFAAGSLTYSSAEELSEQGLPTNYGQFYEDNLVPDDYVAVASPGGSHWFGRSGNVRGGSPGREIIALSQR
jgi:hypothetical protein